MKRFFEPNWQRVARNFEEEDREKAVIQQADQDIWHRLTVGSGDTNTAPNEQTCLAQMDAALQKGGRFPMNTLQAMWHSRRFHLRPEGGVVQASEMSSRAEREREAFADFITQYGNTVAQKELPVLIQWKEQIFEASSRYDSMYTFSPEMLSDPESSLAQVKRIKRDGRALQRQWVLDNLVRALRGRLTREQAERVWDDINLTATVIEEQTGTEILPPCARGYDTADDFINAYAASNT